MPDTPPTVSFQLPVRISGESYVVTLDNGTTILRTRDELARAPKR
jgi:hypothetical protein